jgi:midasin (ATPase involved in ribosome maturation)
MTKQVSLNVKEVKSFLTHIIQNNRYLQENGKLPVAVEVVGDSGIGKTSTIVQLANELDLKFVKLNLAQIEELGDLVGFPIRQFEVCLPAGDCLWIDEHAVIE